MNAFCVKNERKLLMKKNFAYSFRRFSAFPFYQYVLDVFRWGYKAAADRARKNKLKKKCACQDMFRSTPPQEQGTRCQYPVSTRPMYPVKSAISAADKISPAFCPFSVRSRMTAANSAAGTRYNSASATSGGKFWLFISWRNFGKSASLLIAAYANSRMSRAGAAVLKRFFIVFGDLLGQSKALEEGRNSGKWVVYPFGGYLREDWL
jgi:hypothetical protein